VWQQRNTIQYKSKLQLQTAYRGQHLFFKLGTLKKLYGLVRPPISELRCEGC